MNPTAPATNPTATAAAAVALPRRPRLKESVEVFPASDGDLYLLRAGGEADLVIRRAGGAERALLAALDGGREIGELPAAVRAACGSARADEVLGAVAQLQEIGLLEDAAGGGSASGSASGGAGAGALDPEELARYDRQLAYFADAAPAGESRFELQRRLAAARVVVIGVGGLGSWALAGLACAGVGQLVGVDDDTIELSNLNRQILYRRSDVGRPKVEVAAEAIAAFNPSIEVVGVRRRVRGPGDVAELIEGADFAVECADWPPHAIGRWVNAACMEAGVPHIAASQFPPFIRVGPAYVPGVTGCLECQERRTRREFPLFDELVAFRQARPSTAATLGPASGIVGSAIAMELVHHLTGICPPASLGAALMIDLRTMEVRREPVPREDGCPVCGAAPPPHMSSRAEAPRSGATPICHPERRRREAAPESRDLRSDLVDRDP